jgi:hypothetical protein
MAMKIFFLLNGFGVVFLLYVLAQFWNDGQRPRNNARKYGAKLGRRDWADVIVVSHPISHAARGGVTVIPFQPRHRAPRDKPARAAVSRKAVEMPMTWISTRQGN